MEYMLLKNSPTEYILKMMPEAGDLPEGAAGTQGFPTEIRDAIIARHLPDILKKHDLTPLNGIEILSGDWQPDAAPLWTAAFEVFPEITLPDYEGLEAIQEESVVDDLEIALALEEIRNNQAEIKTGQLPIRKGQFVTLDYEVMENGAPVQGLGARNLEVQTGSDQLSEEFENLVEQARPGEAAIGSITFPGNHANPEAAGKTLELAIYVKKINERVYPEIDDDLARKAGFASLAELKENIYKSLKDLKEKENRRSAEKELLAKLLSRVDIPLPKSMVQMEARFLTGERLRQGGNNSPLEEIYAGTMQEAREQARIRILLLTVAKKAGIEVTSDEVKARIMESCEPEEFEERLDKLEKSGLLARVRDNMIYDRSLEHIYQKAKITFIKP